MTLVIALEGIDISVGSVLAISGAMALFLLDRYPLSGLLKEMPGVSLSDVYWTPWSLWTISPGISPSRVLFALQRRLLNEYQIHLIHSILLIGVASIIIYMT